MNVTASLLAPAADLSAGAFSLQKRAAAELANTQSLFGQSLRNAEAQAASGASAGAVIFNASLPTTLPAAASASGASASAASVSGVTAPPASSQGFIAGLKAYAAQALSAGAAETGSAERLGSPALDFSA
jgi:hypothetical protein